MSKLKSIGLSILRTLSVVKKEAQLAQVLLPVASLLLPRKIDLDVTPQGTINLKLQNIIDVIQGVEATAVVAGGLSGPQKLQLATAQVTSLLAAAGLADPKKFQTVERYQEAITGIVNAFVAFENAQEDN